MRASRAAAKAEIASALQAQSVRAGADAPQVRGSDWRTAVVTAVGTDGTVTAGGVVCRRLETYTSPAVDDLVVISRSGNGNWFTWGRLAS